MAWIYNNLIPIKTAKTTVDYERGGGSDLGIYIEPGWYRLIRLRMPLNIKSILETGDAWCPSVERSKEPVGVTSQLYCRRDKTSSKYVFTVLIRQRGIEIATNESV